MKSQVKRIIAVPVCNYFVNDNRVMRTCKLLSDIGFDVHVLAMARNDLKSYEKISTSISVHRFGINKLGKQKKSINFLSLISFFYWLIRSIRWVITNNTDSIHLNDWESVPVAWMSLSFGRKNVVYDMHEFFQDSDSLAYASFIKPLIQYIDKVGLNKSDKVVCVSEEIRQELVEITTAPVIVVRNIPDFYNSHLSIATATDLPANNNKFLVHLGGTQDNRGLFEFLDTLAFLPDEFVLVCFSPEHESLTRLKDAVEKRNMENRVIFRDPVEHSLLSSVIRNAWAGLSLLKPDCMKIDYALPNKLFEYVNIGIPVISTNVLSQSNLIIRNNLGILVDLSKPQENASKLLAWGAEKIPISHLQNIGLTWESEKLILKNIYT